MKYHKIIEAIFLKRPNRFIAHVLIHDVEVVAHVRNTGRCKELLTPGARVILEDCSSVPNRKTKYSLTAVWKANILINIDSQVPNKVVFDALNSGKIKALGKFDLVKREVTFGNSRYDIYFEQKKQKGFIEVKGVTLEHDGISMFPDAPTLRGRKHVHEMIKALEQGYRGIIFFLIQMKGPKSFHLNWKMDKEFSEAIVFAKNKGVEILAYDSIVSVDGISIGDPIEINLSL